MTNSIRCDRCGVTVPLDKINAPWRCRDPKCPLNRKEHGMQRKPVVSSNISAVGYDAEHSVLEIEFKGGGAYRYLQVPHDFYMALEASESPGRHFHQHIKGRFAHEKIEAKIEGGNHAAV